MASKHDEKKESGGCMGCEHALESVFEKIGAAVGQSLCSAYLTAILAFVFMLLIVPGFGMLKTESRPEGQWVPTSAPALVESDWIKNSWSSDTRINLYAAKCKDETADCNILEPKYIQALNRVHKAIEAIVIDGDALVKKITDPKKGQFRREDPEVFDMYKGTWSFQGNSTNSTAKKCFEFGPFCGKQTFLDLFRENTEEINGLDMAKVLRAANFWETQTNICPVSIAAVDSPCVNALTFFNSTELTDGIAVPRRLSEPKALYVPQVRDCQTYKTAGERQSCRVAAERYCHLHCRTTCRNRTKQSLDPVTKQVKRETVCDIPVPETCENGRPCPCSDTGCLLVQGFQNIESVANTDDDGAVANAGNGSAPAAAFEFEPFKLENVLGKIGRDAAGNVVSATAISGFYMLARNNVYLARAGSDRDPLADEWESQALCLMGIDTESKPADRRTSERCPGDPLLKFNPNFSRSLGDEFGAAIGGDLLLFIVACVIIVVYLFVMLSDWDGVHSKIGMATVTLLVVMASYLSASGLAAYLDMIPCVTLKNNNLNQLVPFLLLGLGVDDAFVLTSEFNRACKLHPKAPISRRIALTAKHGGMSILITSATDALAFLIGSATVLPALSWFCQFSGIGVIFCFIFQVFIFLPCLAIDAHRAEANRQDCCCCIKRKGPQHQRAATSKLESGMRNFGNALMKPVGRILTLVMFAALLGAGIAGMTKLYKNFKLEWFIPSDSYVVDFFQINDPATGDFKAGTQFNVYTGPMDYFANQRKLHGVVQYLNTSALIDDDAGVTSWYATFMEAQQNNQEVLAGGMLTDDRLAFKTKADFYARLHAWYRDGTGVRYRSSIKWLDHECENSTLDTWTTDECDPAAGLNNTRMSATIALAYSDQGGNRYDTMTQIRKNISELMGGQTMKHTKAPLEGSCGSGAPEEVEIPVAFPFSPQFLYWEEMGVIDMELLRNLIICGSVILIMIFLMIPRPRIAIFVAIAIIMSIVDVVGLLHFWDVQINGVSTIYILVSVGLAVDYSAHIAHMFKESRGSSKERAVEAMARIGPSVFNAVISTFLAVLVMAWSKSFIFQIFFKALFLVTVIAGAHGLWLLPVLLSIFGGDNGSLADPDADGGQDSPREEPAVVKAVVVAPEVVVAAGDAGSSDSSETGSGGGGGGKPITADAITVKAAAGAMAHEV